MIAIPLEIYRRLGIQRFEVLVNSIGCEVCRPAYRAELKAWLAGRLDQLCPTCRSRYERNPLSGSRLQRRTVPPGDGGRPSAVGSFVRRVRPAPGACDRAPRALGIEYRMDPRLVRGTRLLYQNGL